MPVPEAVSDVYRYSFTLAGHDLEYYDVADPTLMTFQVGCLSFDVTDSPAGEVKTYWGRYKNRQAGVNQAFVTEIVPFTIHAVNGWDESDYRILRQVLNSRYLTVLDVDTDRFNTFYKDNTAFSVDEIADYNIAPIFDAVTFLPVVWSGYESVLNDDEGQRELRLTFERRDP